MTIEQSSVIDFITVDEASGEVWLTISDHLPWTESTHLPLLQDKLNAYLRFIESGELLKKTPQVAGHPVIINLVCKFKPSEQGELFLRKATTTIQKAGFDLRVELKLPN